MLQGVYGLGQIIFCIGYLHHLNHTSSKYLLLITEYTNTFLKTLFILFYFLAALGLRCCTWAFSSCGKQGLLFLEVRRLLIAVASLVAEQGL